MTVDERLDRIEQRLGHMEALLAEMRGRLAERERMINVGMWALPLLIGASAAAGIVLHRLGLWR